MAQMGAREYLVVRLDGEPRAVLIDGIPQGKTNTLLEVEPGRHTVSLDPSEDSSPPQQIVDVKDTSSVQPSVAQFEIINRSEPTIPRESGVAVTVPPDWVPLGRAKALKPSRTMMHALALAENYALAVAVPIDATLLLYALVEAGLNQRDHNTARILAESVGNRFNRVQDHLNEHDRSPERGRWRNGGAYFTAGAWRVFEAAHDLRTRISPRDPYVSARHVLAAFLASPDEQPPDGALALLTAADVNLDALRNSFRGAMLDSKLPDAPGAWRRLPLRPIVPRAVVSRFNADLSVGEDRLDIQRDVNAMACLIASRALVPPLSIGLFGNWGSGKSFFITKLEAAVRGLSEGAEKGQAGFRDAYWTKIVQVQFNAWHFVDANLWASLVSHIFDELHRWGTNAPGPVQKAKTDALENLRVATEARAAADARLQQAQEARDKALRVRNKRIDTFNARRREFAAAVGRDLWQEVGKLLGGVGKTEREQLEKLGVAVGDTATDAQRLYSRLTELQTLPGRLYAAGTLMLGHGAWKPALAVFLAMTAGVLGVAVFAGDARTLVGLVGQGASLVTGAAVWLGRGMKEVSSALEPLQRFHGKLDKHLKDEEAKKAAEVAQLDKEVQRLQADCAEATKLFDQAQQRVQAAQAEVQVVETGRLITRFIEQRAASADYRKHLGIVSLIRDDFDRLSGLIKAYNDSRLQAPKPGAPVPQDLGINRIVLYIDDLDRCPADRVVEVLQAIHLLLAFPLFVVVVAVDARWMATSLQTQYTGMLKERAATRAANGEAGTAPATPRDYLEKIFQVPFWVQPMVPAGTQRLIAELLKYDIPATVGQEATPVTQSPPGGPPGPRPAPTTGATAAKPAEPPSPERLQIDETEAAAMAQLAPIIGRSPRATKRFVNVYRLLKAALPMDEHDAFAGGGEAPGGFRAAMLLLAVTAGLPMLTGRVFRDIATGKPGARRVGAIFKEALAATADGDDEDLAEERRRLAVFLATPDSAAWTALPVMQLSPWVVRIAQFTFDARVT